MLTLRVKPVKEQQGVSIRLVLTIARVRSYMSTGIQVPEQYFNPKATLEKANWISSKHPLGHDLNQRILSIYSALSSHINELIKNNELGTPAEAIKSFKAPAISTYLLEYMTKFVSEQRDKKSSAWLEKYNTVLEKVKTYLAGKDLPIASLSHAWLDEYRVWLEGAGKYKSATAARHLSFIRTVILYAVSAKHIEYQSNPFLNYRIKSGKVIREKLTEDELILLLTTEGQDLKEQQALDTWKLQYYLAGMRISDVLQLKNADLGADYIKYQAQKTDKLHVIPIVPQAAELIAKYKNNKTYLLPYLNKPAKGNINLMSRVEAATAYINKHLVPIGQRLGINARVTTHQARHSFAETARRSTTDLYTISKAMGHSDLKTTENYFSSTDHTAVSKLVSSIFAASHKPDTKTTNS